MAAPRAGTEKQQDAIVNAPAVPCFVATQLPHDKRVRKRLG